MLKVMLNQNRILCIKSSWLWWLWPNWVSAVKQKALKLSSSQEIHARGHYRGCNPDYVWKIVYHQTACASFILLQRSLIRTAKHPWYNQLSMYTHLPGKNRTEQLSCLLAKVRMSIFPKGQTCMLKKYKNHFESTNLHQGSWLSIYF